MRPPATGSIAAGVIGVVGIVLIAVGTPGTRKPAAPVAATSAPAAASAVSAGGFTLASTSVDLPADTATFPAGRHADVVNARCTSCHSAAMALNQPALSADQWKATVTKMREVYKAPIADGEVPAIIAYLTAMPGQTSAPAPAKSL